MGGVTTDNTPFTYRYVEGSRSATLPEPSHETIASRQGEVQPIREIGGESVTPATT